MPNLFRALAAAMLLLVHAPPRGADMPAGADTRAKELVFAISEGTSGAQDVSEMAIKYEGLRAYIARALGRKVTLLPTRDFATLETGMREARFDIVLARPSDYPARAIRDYRYSLVVTTKGDGQVLFIVDKNSALNSLEQIRGARIALPENVSYMGRMAAAALRDKGIDVSKEPHVSYHRDQAVIGFAVENGMTNVGAVASYSSVGKDWSKKGRILHAGPLQPYMPIIAAPSLHTAELDKLRDALAGMDKTDEGKGLLKQIGVPGFERRDPQDLTRLLKWLGL